MGMKEQIVSKGKPQRMLQPAWVKDEDKWAKAKAAADRAKTAPDDYYAVVTTIYKNMGGRVGSGKGEAEGNKDTPPKKPSGAGTTSGHSDLTDVPEDVRKMLVDHPAMSAATFCNLLKSRGFGIVDGNSDVKGKSGGKDGDKDEADSGSSNAPSTRAGVAAVNPLKKKKKESAVSPKTFTFRSVKLQEKSKSDDGIGPTVFKATLLQEGLGNLKDTYYYTKDALESAVAIFEGKKIYADHPSESDESNRPERSVRDILGYFENVAYEEGDDGRGALVADVCLVDEQPYSWARGLMRIACTEYAKKFPDKEFVGLSINASGDAQETTIDDFLNEANVPDTAIPKLKKAKEEGIDTIRLVHEITDAVSCDLVTEAGAGGKVMSLIEQERENMKKEKELSAKEKKALKEGKKAEGESEDEDDGEDVAQDPKAKKKPAGDKTDHGQEGEDDKAGKDGDGDGDHDDEDQDKAMLKKAFQKAFGDDKEMDESEEESMKAAMKCAQELGYEGEDAEAAAATYAKMAKHMASKKAEEAMKQGEDEEEKKEVAESEDEAKKESAKIAKLAGQVAALTEKLKAHELKAYLDKKLAESKLSRKATDKIRESLGPVAKIRDEKQIDREVQNFLEGYNLARGESGDALIDSLVSTTEKRELTPEGSKLDLTDCQN